MGRLGAALFAVVLGMAAEVALAQGTFPARPVRMVVGFAPGGGTEGCIAVGGTPEALTALIRSEYQLWSKVVKTGGVRVE